VYGDEEKMGKLYVCLNKMILFIFSAICFCLFISSLKWVTKMNFQTFREGTMIVSRNSALTFVCVAALSFVLVLLFNITSKIKHSGYILIVVIAVHVILSVIWIINNTYPLEVDQRSVWEAAVALENGEQIADLDYFYHYPFQVGMVYVMRAVVHLTGISDPFIWKCFNIIALVLFDIGIFLLNIELFGEKGSVINAIVPILLIGFFPMILYTAFVYGTMLSIALVTWSLVGTSKIISGKKNVWALAPIVLIPIANRVYSGTLIATVAIVVALIIASFLLKGKKQLFLLSVAALVVCISILSGVLVRYMFYRQTALAYRNSGVPATAYIYMGSATDGGVTGPGSYSEVAVELFDSYGEATSGKALDLCKEAFGEYISGARSLDFFVEKMKYQWLDPLFGGLTMTCHYYGRYEVADSFESFLASSIFENSYKYWLKYYIPSIYFLTLIGAVALLFDKRTCLLKCLLSIYFIGGFIFQFFWESKSRYCFAYFLFLIPIAAYGIKALYEIFTGIKKNKITDKKIIKRSAYVVIAIQLIILIASILMPHNNANDITVSDFYSAHSGEMLSYTDSSYDDEMRDIESDSFVLNKGYYRIDVFYTSNFLPEEKHGASIYPIVVSDGYEYCLTDEYVFMDEDGKASFEVYVPHDNCEVKMRAIIGDETELLTVSNETKYILMDHITVSSQNMKNKLSNFMSILGIMIIFDFIVFYIVGEKYGK